MKYRRLSGIGAAETMQAHLSLSGGSRVTVGRRGRNRAVRRRPSRRLDADGDGDDNTDTYASDE